MRDTVTISPSPHRQHQWRCFGAASRHSDTQTVPQ
jgi:hypothetical protein